MAVHSYTTNARQDTILTQAAAAAGLTVAAFVQRIFGGAIEAALDAAAHQARQTAIMEFQAAMDAGQDLRVRFDPTTGIITTQRQARS